MAYFDAVAHLELARNLREQGDVLTAFFVAERARRTLFPEEEFDRAFGQVFKAPDPFDNSPEAEAELRERLERGAPHPDLLRDLADVYISRSEWSRAIPLLEEAVELAPPDFSTVAALAEVHRRDGRPGMAERLLTSFERDHPDDVAKMTMQVERLARQDPDRARAILDRAIASYADDAQLHYLDGALKHRAGDVDGARTAYEKAAVLGPDVAKIQGWVARFFLKALGDEEEALERYLTAYFLDPHFYDSEYAESRVRTLAWARAERRLAGDLRAGESWSRILRGPDPVAVGMALDRVEHDWGDEQVPVLVELLGHDDVSVRWRAMNLLRENAGSEHDPVLGSLLESPDLRVVGIGIYIVVDRSEHEGIATARKLLDHPAELVRFDAISALMLHGGELGREVVEEYDESGMEPNERIREWLHYNVSQRAEEPASADPRRCQSSGGEAPRPAVQGDR